MALTDSAIRSARPKAKPYKLSDGEGMFLLVTTSGGKLWRLKYRFSGQERLLAIGQYPVVGLKDARKRRDEARELLAEGIDPSLDKKRKAVAAAIQASNTFKVVAQELCEKLEREGVANATKVRNDRCIKQLEPDLGHRPVSEIEPYEILNALKKFERRGIYETANRLRAFAARVFRYAIVTGRAKVNPAADISEALVKPKTKHMAAIVDPQALGELLRAVETFDKYMTTTLALKLTPHLFVRPGELRHMEWTEVDFEAKIWRIPPEKMKMRNEHVVPLSRQALEILSDAKALANGGSYVFPSIRTWLRPMSENTINVALRRLGYSGDEMTAHGFRSTASTLLNESGLWSPDAIERALAHKGGDRVRAIYHRGAHWDERVRMAQWWSDYLDRLRDGAEIVPIYAA
ncbi:integrase arm-type DNA-binding domain-containing protein [Asticcacaulis sp.]|uniref:tyrosine-type recombinase/integrase n=1 Tax=Asticcacaulis sp. TaxID=1872648 RepID=UPI0026064C5E|nr:integrase arm-type DNA-binding domain-containing protein [Asticcacaulis sp.]